MTEPADPELRHWATLLEELRWAAFLLDRDLRLVWASSEIARFLGSPTEEDLGYGLHVTKALSGEAWRRIATPESRARFWKDVGPFVAGDAAPHDQGLSGSVRAAIRESGPRPLTRAVASSLEYVEPDSDTDLPVYRVNLVVAPLRDEHGTFVGALALGYMSVRPGLVSLLARGDEAMYERMAKLVEPRSKEGAILFCDLEGSTDLARTLPSAEYFRLVRSLWTEIDALVARSNGIVGKHAGDGASAFFLVDDLGSASRAASAAITTARGIHDRAETVFGGASEPACLMRVGVHWGSSIYVGQLVPGGRLDVAALGDAVNECARIQESAPPGRTLASKPLVERLAQDDAARLDIDAEQIRYRPLEELDGASEKAAAVAGAIPVATP
ncbi:MAG TPA: adenylate/guanylate cyclase domain-containing protein [Actinomycetota bacterium]|nr:adenylate/guanylate cyclase domain-containing protein [Actinomycetota bacterium]